MAGKSHVPVAHGFPNPFYARMKKLVASQEDWKYLVAQVKKISLAGGGRRKTVAEILQDPAVCGVRKEFDRLVDEFEGQKPTKPVLGPPPRAVELYGRFGKGTSIFDIGSGNCVKIRRFTGSLDVVANDVELSGYSDLVLKPLKGPFLQHLPLVEGRYLTSFMALCQLDYESRKEIYNRDGLHVIPDHKYLLSEGIGALDDEGRVVVRTIKGDYVDHLLDLEGYEVAPGYKLVVVYKRQDIDIAIGGDECPNQPPVIIDASPIDVAEVNLYDCTWKVDGVPYELELYNQMAYIVDRCGVQRIGTTTFKGHCCLHVEESQGRWFLLRVLIYNGMVPPHASVCLKWFVKRVRLKINGAPLEAPQDWNLGNVLPDYKQDGVVTRLNERDYYVKPYWTVDFDPPALEKFKKKLTQKGYYCRAAPENGLYQYRMDRIKDRVILVPEKPRIDKDAPTGIDTALRMLEQRNLGEIEALTGSPHQITKF